jgi:hypothetical protein
MNTSKIVVAIATALAWIPVVFFSLLLSHNAMLYFTHGGEYGILPEKTLAQQDIFWNIAFYIHLPTGTICLLAPIFLFMQRHFKKALPAHQLVGKVYVWITLIFVCPTGMYLALYAKGGVITQAGFLLQGILLALYTWKGYQKIITRDKMMHVQYMVRSYAVVAVVLSFRILHIIFFLLKVPYQDNYAISQWLGLTGNLLLAEFIIAYVRQNKHTHKNQITTL